MRSLVTGGSGFLGRFLCSALLQKGDEVTALSSRTGDLTDLRTLTQFNNNRYDTIYHLAAWTQAGDFCLHNPGEQWIRNQGINTNVITWWVRHQPQAKLISIGTSCSYDPAYPLSEENYLLGTPIDSLYTYAMTKRMLHLGQISVAKQFGLHFLTAVPSTLYGPNYHTDGRQMHFIFDLIVKILRGKLYGDPVVLWGDGYQRREIVHVDDFTRALIRLAELMDNELVNIGAGEDHSIREFAHLISQYVGFDPARIQYDESRYVGARAKSLVVGKLRSILPDFEMTDLTDGLPTTIDWIRENVGLTVSK